MEFPVLTTEIPGDTKRHFYARIRKSYLPMMSSLVTGCKQTFLDKLSGNHTENTSPVPTCKSHRQLSCHREIIFLVPSALFDLCVHKLGGLVKSDEFNHCIWDLSAPKSNQGTKQELCIRMPRIHLFHSSNKSGWDATRLATCIFTFVISNGHRAISVKTSVDPEAAAQRVIFFSVESKFSFPQIPVQRSLKNSFQPNLNSPCTPYLQKVGAHPICIPATPSSAKIFFKPAIKPFSQQPALQ